MTTSIISLWRPWAEWVMLGWKPIETRLHTRFEKLVGKRIGIHAAKVWDRKAIDVARPYLTAEQIASTYEILRTQPAGVLLGTIFVEDFRLLEPSDSEAALIECETIRYGLILSAPIKLHCPRPMRGHQGIWKAEIL
jgi:hypothetical protein